MESLWQKVTRWTHAIGDFQARVILTFLYGVLVLPTGLIARLGGELLPHQRTGTPSYWQSRSSRKETIRSARGQG